MSQVDPGSRAAAEAARSPSAGGPGSEEPRFRRRLLGVFVVAQVVGATGLAAGATAGGLLARDVAGSDAVAGLPLATLVLGAAVSAVPITRVMARQGRRRGLVLAYGLAALGALMVIAAARLGSLGLLLVGNGLFGAGNSAVMLARYAAGDLGAAGARARAISTVVLATTVGAVLGPNLLGPAGVLAEPFGVPSAAGLYVVALVAFGLAAGVLALRLRPDPSQLGTASSDAPLPGSAPTVPAPAGTARLGLAVLAGGNLVMVAVMALAPIHLATHGHGLTLIGALIGGHIAGMYAPAVVTGPATDRFGARPVAAVGAVLLLAATAFGALAEPTGSLGVGGLLVVLGVGWNATLVSGSVLLTAGGDPGESARLEGFGELGMGIAAAVGAGGAGPLSALGGYGLVCLAGAIASAGLLAALARSARTA